jgi:hypothetical protein
VIFRDLLTKYHRPTILNPPCGKARVSGPMSKTWPHRRKPKKQKYVPPRLLRLLTYILFMFLMLEWVLAEIRPVSLECEA